MDFGSGGSGGEAGGVAVENLGLSCFDTGWKMRFFWPGFVVRVRFSVVHDFAAFGGGSK